jgi:hypothetical protein
MIRRESQQRGFIRSPWGGSLFMAFCCMVLSGCDISNNLSALNQLTAAFQQQPTDPMAGIPVSDIQPTGISSGTHGRPVGSHLKNQTLPPLPAPQLQFAMAEEITKAGHDPFENKMLIHSAGSAGRGNTSIPTLTTGPQGGTPSFGTFPQPPAFPPPSSDSTSTSSTTSVSAVLQVAGISYSQQGAIAILKVLDGSTALEGDSNTPSTRIVRRSDVVDVLGRSVKILTIQRSGVQVQEVGNAPVFLSMPDIVGFRGSSDTLSENDSVTLSPALSPTLSSALADNTAGMPSSAAAVGSHAIPQASNDHSNASVPESRPSGGSTASNTAMLTPSKAKQLGGILDGLLEPKQ